MVALKRYHETRIARAFTARYPFVAAFQPLQFLPAPSSPPASLLTRGAPNWRWPDCGADLVLAPPSGFHGHASQLRPDDSGEPGRPCIKCLATVASPPADTPEHVDVNRFDGPAPMCSSNTASQGRPVRGAGVRQYGHWATCQMAQLRTSAARTWTWPDARTLV